MSSVQNRTPLAALNPHDRKVQVAVPALSRANTAFEVAGNLLPPIEKHADILALNGEKGMTDTISDCTSMRFSFAFFGYFECYGYVTTATANGGVRWR